MKTEHNSLTDWDIIVVSHRSARALRSEWSLVPATVRDRVICVENGQDADSVQLARDLFPRVIETKNEGLSVANNVGFAAGHAKYVLFANPDLQCDEAGLVALAARLEEAPGIVAPRLVYADGQPQESCRSWPSPIKQVRNRLGGRRSEAARDYRWPDTTSGYVPWVLGAAIATRRIDLDAVGGWPEEYFLYFEDTELSWRYWDAGLSVSLLENVRWHHAWSRSSHGPLNRAFWLHVRSMLRFYASHPSMLVGRKDRAVSRSRVLASNPQEDARD